MAFEVLGADLGTSEGKDAFATVYAFVGGRDSILGVELTETDRVAEWARELPVDAQDFFAFCAHHSDSAIRELAAEISVDLTEAVPEYVVEILEALLQDPDESVRRGAQKSIHNILVEEGDEQFMSAIGLFGVARLVRGYRSVNTPDVSVGTSTKSD